MGPFPGLCNGHLAIDLFVGCLPGGVETGVPPSPRLEHVKFSLRVVLNTAQSKYCRGFRRYTDLRQNLKVTLNVT